MHTFVRHLAAMSLVMAMLVAGLAASPAEAQAETRQPLKVVLIGNSYAAGNGARDANGNRNYDPPKGCYRSPTNWASQYVAGLEAQGYDVTFVNRACSGGVIPEYTSRREMETKSRAVFAPADATETEVERLALIGPCATPFPADEEYEVQYQYYDSFVAAHFVDCTRFLKPQLDAVGPDTDLVLMTGGGNDVEFAEIVKQCFAPFLRDPGSCRNLVEDANDLMEGVKTDLAEAVLSVRDRARPDTKVAVVGYPFLANNDDFELVYKRLGIWESDRYDAARQVRLLGLKGDEAQQEAVDNANAAAGANFATFVNIKDLFTGHEPKPELGTGNPDRWINEIEQRILIENFHYNAEGHRQLGQYLLGFGTFGAGSSGGVSGNNLDLAFVVDTTGSMGDDIAAVRASLNAIIDQLETSTASYRVAVVDYRDFASRTGDPADYPSNLVLDFSSDTDDIRAAVNGLGLGFGGDFPETMWSGLMEAFELDWRPGVKKVALQFGDAPALNPEPITGHTIQSVIAKSLSIDPVAVYAVDTGSAGSEIREVAEGTGGEVLVAPTPAEVAEQIADIIETATNAPYAWVGTSYAGVPGQAIAFSGTGSFDGDGEIVSWEWDVDGDGAFETTTAGPALSHTYAADYSGLVTLRVTDNDGLIGLATAPVDISVDGDGVDTEIDNCPETYNPGQEDDDEDGVGDLCDPDWSLPAQDQEGVGVAVGPAPTADIIGGPYAGNVGQVIDIEGVVGDPEGDVVTPTWYPSAECAVADPGALSTSVTCDAEGTFALFLAADDGNGGVVAAETSVTIGDGGGEGPCDILVPTITGTEGDDVIRGTSGDDIIFALGGDDDVMGRGGDDIICLGDGDDTADGDNGSDTIYGEGGNDRLLGGVRDDFLDGGPGDDYLNGEKNNDTLIGGEGRDELVGAEGDDDLSGGAGDDILRGQGDDDILDGGGGNDEIYGGSASDTAYGGDGNDKIRGDGGNDPLLDGGPGVDDISGGGGTDACVNGETVTACEL